MTHLLFFHAPPPHLSFPFKPHPNYHSPHFTFARTRFGSIRCMANPRRVQKVAALIMRVLSDMLENDKHLLRAVAPETEFGADWYMSSVTTFTDIEVSNDLQVVKVYVSVFGDKRGREVALAGLKAKTKYVRGQIGRRIGLRLTPQIRFIEDEAMERASKVYAILDEIKSEEKEERKKKKEKLMKRKMMMMKRKMMMKTKKMMMKRKKKKKMMMKMMMKARNQGEEDNVDDKRDAADGDVDEVWEDDKEDDEEDDNVIYVN